MEKEIGPLPNPMTPRAPLNWAPETLGPEIRKPHPNDRSLRRVSEPERVFNVVVSLEKKPEEVEPSA